ncbi:hypothetical protein C7447_102323 [Tenacibaculum adriaticum]|uniref:Uncharacterized protein n=1 Tax=Tenacibaculum adriaticum TaxID=413713 RepID=A0A5S5DTA2_9FLAO|nr:hypothetical protein [Tenacibaculum adriaticum]TYP99005.1 hypothetical protein C7447_102323 [Tenacibaculum adriaticum]
MNKNIGKTENKSQEISRKEAIKKISNYGKYATITALGTYIILNPKKAQAASPEPPGGGF